MFIYGIFQLGCTAEVFVRNCLRAHCAAHVINIFTKVNIGNGSMYVCETLFYVMKNQDIGKIFISKTI